MRKLLQGGNAPKDYWTYALNHTVFIHNHFDFKTNGNTPWEAIRNTTFEVQSSVHLPPFGCKITSYNNNTVQKVFRANFNGIFLGFNFTTKIAFFLLNNGKIIRTSSFQTFDHIYPFKKNVPRALLNDEFDTDYSISTGLGGASGYGAFNMTGTAPTKNKSVFKTTKTKAANLSAGNNDDNNNKANRSQSTDNRYHDTNGTLTQSVVNNNNNDNNHAPLTSNTTTNGSSTLTITANDQNLQQPKETTTIEQTSVPKPLQTTNEVIETTSATSDSLHTVDNSSNANPNFNNNDNEFLPNEDRPVSFDTTRLATSPVNNNSQTNNDSSSVSTSRSTNISRISKVSKVSKVTKTSKKGNKGSEVSQRAKVLDLKSSSSTSTKKDQSKTSPSVGTANTNSNSTKSKRSAHDPLENEPHSKVLRLLPRNKKQPSSTSNESSNRLPPGTPFKVPPISKQTMEQTKLRKANVPRRKTVKSASIIPQEINPQSPTTRLIPAKRSHDDNVLTQPVQYTSINPLKRITKSMTNKISSIAGENPLSNNSNSMNHQINLLVSNNKYIIPTTYNQAMKTSQKNQWIKACEEELNAMKKLDVYTLVDKNKLKGKSIIKGRWVFNVKQEADGFERFKARLVAKGFTQELGHNYIETFSHIHGFNSILIKHVCNQWLGHKSNGC